jgi:hypothetical protein
MSCGNHPKKTVAIHDFEGIHRYPQKIYTTLKDHLILQNIASSFPN